MEQLHTHTHTHTHREISQSFSFASHHRVITFSMGLPFGKGKHINHHQPAYVCTQREELTSLSPSYNMAGGTSHQKEEIKLCYSLNATLDNDFLVIQNFCSVLHGVFVLTFIICLSGHMEKSLLQCLFEIPSEEKRFICQHY